MIRLQWSKITPALFVIILCSVGELGQSTKDPHRPACTDSACRTARAYVKVHYCGKSPYGNGPDDGCDIPGPVKKLAPDTSSVADYKCDFGPTNEPICSQIASMAPEFRAALLDQMHQLGLPKQDDERVLFKALTSSSTGWFVLEAYYQRVSGENLSLCQFIAATSPDKEFHALRKVRYQTTDADVPAVSTWTPIDIATVGRQQEFILQGDLYEDHWFEAYGLVNGEPKMIFSGLGYYL